MRAEKKADRRKQPRGNGSTRQIDRPMPSDAAKRGLLHVDTVEVFFGGGNDRDQEEALNHISELIEFWNLRYREWTP